MRIWTYKLQIHTYIKKYCYYAPLVNFLNHQGFVLFGHFFVCLLVSTVCLSSCCKKDIYIVWYYQPWQVLSLRTFRGTTFRRCHSRSRTHLHCNFHHSYHRGFHCVHRHPPRNSVRQVLGWFSPAHRWISKIETYQVNRCSEALKSFSPKFVYTMVWQSTTDKDYVVQSPPQDSMNRTPGENCTHEVLLWIIKKHDQITKP